MTGFVNPLARNRKPGYPQAIDRIKAAMRSALDLPDEVTVSVTELACREPGCPDMETVVAIFSAGRKPITVRLPVPIPAVTDGDLHAALASLRSEGDAPAGSDVANNP